MRKGWEKVFYMLSFLFQGSSYLSPRAYAIMHRMHHAFADTSEDPHSPRYDANPFDMMWRTRTVYNRIFERVTKVDPKFLKDLPDWAAFDKFASHSIIRLLWIAAYILVYILLDAHWWLFPLIAIHAVMGPFHGVIINWFAHSIGYINFRMKDTSRNLFPVDLLMWGEGLHNNHHKFSGRANFGVRKFEFDPLYPIIRLLAWAGVVQLRRPAE